VNVAMQISVQYDFCSGSYLFSLHKRLERARWAHKMSPLQIKKISTRSSTHPQFRLGQSADLVGPTEGV
jgi:hypothetical protein